MGERFKLYASKPSMLDHSPDHPTLKDTVVIIPHLTKEFRTDDFKVVITPLRDTHMLPVFHLDGKDIEEKDYKNLFLDGSFGLYIPQKQEGDMILIQVFDGVMSKSKMNTYSSLIRYEGGEWKYTEFKLPIEIDGYDNDFTRNESDETQQGVD